jgi:glycine betaine/proline transport system permease protein
VALFMALAWYLQRSWKVCIGVLLGFLFIINQGYWEETTESLTLILSACVVCMGVGVPIGIAAAHRPRLYAAMVPVLDLMQTLPTFVYLIPAIVFFGLGMVPYALPQIMAGLNQTIMLSLSMVVIAALVGANGLGVPVIRALNSVNTALGFESGFIIVVVAILLDRSLRMKTK